MDMRIGALDGMRGIAVSGVLLLHLFPAELFWFWCWVDMFFVLSGYLITSIVLSNVTSGSFSFANFFARRAIRIWPVYYFTLAGTAALWFLAEASGQVPTTNFQWWPNLIFAQNYQGYSGPWTGYSTIVPWFRHSWSIAAEEQFYLFWPLLIVIFKAGYLRLTLCLATVLVAGIWMRSEQFMLILLLTRVDGIVLGAFLAIIFSNSSNIFSRLNRAPVFLSCGMAGFTLCCAYLYQGYTANLQSYSDIAAIGNWTWNVFGFALVFFAFTGLILRGDIPGIAATLSHPALRFLGTISYAVYMTQGLVRAACRLFLDQFGIDDHLAIEGLTITMTIGLATLSWHYLEKPMNKLKRFFPLQGISTKKQLSNAAA